MSTPFIADADRVVEYAPVASTGPFPVPFPVFDDTGADLYVTLDGEPVTNWAAAATTLPGFYGAPNTYELTLTFDTEITGTLVIEGRRAPRRVSQFAEGRGVPARDHNTELNSLTAVQREQHRRQNRIEVNLGRIDDAVASTEGDAAATESALSLTLGYRDEAEAFRNEAESIVGFDGTASSLAVSPAVGGKTNAQEALELLKTSADSLTDTMAGLGFGINVTDAAERVSSFTVLEGDLGLLHIVNPSASSTVLQVTMPAAASFVGKVIAFLVPPSAAGRVQVLTTGGAASSVVSDYASDDFWLFQGETITLYAAANRWEILDWRKQPVHLVANGVASDAALSTVGADVEIAGWTQGFAGTYLARASHAIGGSPVRIILPRRGVFLVEFECFCMFATAPSALYAYTGVNVIANRAYADFIQAASPFQAVIRLSTVVNGATATQIPININCTGGSTPVMAGSIQAPRARLTELA